jgi:hypothetical protein
MGVARRFLSLPDAMVDRSSLFFPTKDVMKGYYSIEIKHGKTALLNQY